jgi:cephalosporin-C deacetylase-like acetyl esterase
VSIVRELKRRNVFRVAVAYLVAAWVLIEVSSLILEIFDAPNAVRRIIVVLLALGLPFAIVFAWAFEVTPEGIKRQSDVDRLASGAPVTAKRLDILTIALVVLGVAVLLADRFVLVQSEVERPPAVVEATLQGTGPAVERRDEAATTRDVLWATQQLREIDRLRERGEYAAAFALAAEVAPLLGEESSSEEFWSGFSWGVDIDTAPAGAQVYRQQIDAAAEDWEELGATPLESVRFPEGVGYRLRFELPGHRRVELLQTAIRGAKWRGQEPMNPIRFDRPAILPAEMVRIPGFTRDGVDHADFFIDRFEVTNRDYERFVSAGGYRTRAFWSHAFTRDGKVVPWDEAMAEFVDRTGRPGPATWRGGAYPPGQEDFPVSGVSWYEAIAYASFVNKELPTAAHLFAVQRFYREDSWLIDPRSNLGSDGPRPVGESRAMNTLGVYDVVGNVREWCWNESGNGGRGTAGGAWTDSPFHAGWIIAKSPWDRDSTNGIRLVQTFDESETLARLRQPVDQRERRDYRREQPASDAEFAVYRRLYAYDALPLNAEVVASDEGEHWVRERVAFDLPYGERGGAILYLPKNAVKPFRTIIYWGPSGLLAHKSADDEYLEAFSFLVRSGLAVVQPIFKGSFDRDDAAFSITHGGLLAQSDGTKYRDFQIKWVQDLSRTIDYLETRDDLESGRLGYYGFSWGGQAAPIVLTVENRIHAAVLNVGGLWDIYRFMPEIDPLNFVTRVRTPVLMLNGQYDVVFPLETAQLPMFELLGTPPEDKKHFVTPAAHIVPKDVLIRETLDWFDRYLGRPGG